MKSVLLVILLLIINAGCYNLLVAEDLRNKFLKLHSKIDTKVSTNETLQNEVSFILKDYKPFLDQLNQLEKNSLKYDFIVRDTNYTNLLHDSANILKYFKSFVNIVNKDFNSNIKYDKTVLQAFKKINFKKELIDFRKKAETAEYFYDFLKINNAKLLEQYSKRELSFLLYQYLTMIDIKGLILASFYKFITNSTLPFPSIAKYSDILLLLNNVSDDIWKLDPNKHVKGKTYVEIEKFLQGVIAYEKHIKPFTCKNECNHYKNATTTTPKCDNFSPDCITIFTTYSSSELRDCEEVSTRLTTCKDTHPRIYKYLKFNNQIYGDKTAQCTKELTFHKSGDCSYCMCIMHNKKYSAKFISLRAVLSNIDQNRIIVGARFQKFNNIIHMQVKEGTLGPFLTVNKTRWVPIENFKINDRMIFENQDFIKVSMNQRSVQLGDFKMSSNNKNLVLTGVRFREWEGFLSLQIRVTLFDLKTGTLHKKNASSWHDIEEIPINEIEIKDSDIPKNGRSSTIVNTKSDQYIKFTHSSLKTDFAQTTVPFFDAQEVVSTGPLRGLGIYYKREVENKYRKSGGFLGIKLLTYDFRDHLKEILKTYN